jgi:hypothetical protein
MFDEHALSGTSITWPAWIEEKFTMAFTALSVASVIPNSEAIPCTVFLF